MRRLLFLARVAFLTNLFFAICLFIRHTHFNVPVAAREFVVINGWIMSVVFNATFTLAVAVCVIARKRTGVTTWLLASNVFCFIFQILYRIYFA